MTEQEYIDKTERNRAAQLAREGRELMKKLRKEITSCTQWIEPRAEQLSKLLFKYGGAGNYYGKLYVRNY